ncbi:hypothetical protein LUZ60_017168 [Juncus effusus]|nr:hypothetical protein LUZ60_017168 [Juncus effusus]
MDWSELPQDLLHLNSKKLSDLSDFIRFRVVCKKWCDSSPLSDPPSQLPWAVSDRKGFPSIVQFYSLSSRKIYSIVLREIEGKRILGSSHHYMLVFDRKSRSLSLLNPLTRSEICLPCTDSDWHRPIYIGPNLIKNGDDVVICWNSLGILTIGSCRPGHDKEWKKIQIPQGSYGQTYNKGKYYVNERETMITRVINLLTGSTEFIVPPLIRTSSGQPSRLDYLINSSGEILGVYSSKWTSRVLEDSKFEIYKLEFGNTNEIYRWIKITGIGDRILFLDDTTGFCLNASEYPGFEGNCIYFIAYLYPELDGSYDYPLCKYNLENGRTEKVVPSAGSMNMSSWFFPSLN